MKIHTGQQIRCDTCQRVFRSTVKLNQHQCAYSEDVEEELYEEEVKDDYEDQAGEDCEEEPREDEDSYDSQVDE